MRKLTLLGLVTLASLASAQNLLVNGDFELSVPNSGTLNGWTAGNNDGSGGWRSSGGNPNGTFILNDAGSPASNPFIEQTVTGLTVGQSYRVAVDYQRAFFSSGNGVNDFGVQADGNTWEFSILNDDSWRSATGVFVASSSSVTVRFTGERYGDTTARIDNASLEVVPEPASLVALSFGALALRKRRKD